MKNLKKIAALGLAAALSMSVGVSAFAEVTATSANANFGSYENGIAKLNANQTILDDTNQWTVVIIDADKATANLTADDLYYINQGTSAEGFWVTNGMGTKVDLATLVSENTPTKDFIIRIGTDKVEQTGVVEIPFTINFNSGAVTWTYGDVNGDGAVDLDDAMEILYYDAFMDSVFDDGEEWRMLAGNVTFESGDTTVDLDDAMEILYYDAFMESVLDHLLQ